MDTSVPVPAEPPPETAEPSGARWASLEELVAEVFEREHAEHQDAETLDAALAMLLEHFPDAPVAAHSIDGVMVDMPDSVKLRRNTVLEGRSGVDMMVHDEEVLRTWEMLALKGAVRYIVRPIRYPNLECLVYALDVRETHGATIIVCVMRPASDAPEATIDEEPLAEPAPRFATMRKDARAVIIDVDEATTKILGWSAEEMKGHRGSEFMHPDDQAAAVDHWISMIATSGPGPRLRVRHRHRDGYWVWLEVTNHNLLGDPDNGCVVAELVDISEEMAAHELLDGLAQAIPVGLLQFDSAGAVAYTNGRLHEILGVERADTVEAQLTSVTDHSRPALRRAMDAVLSSGRAADLEVELYTPDGETRYCAVSLRAVGRGSAVSGAIGCITDVTDNARMREELKRRATYDELTGCYNRSSIMALLEESIADDSTGDRAVMFVDLDRFKAVNDSLGHATGDELLSVVAQRLRNALRAGDVVGRIGGDEFLAVCPNIGGPEQAMKLAERVARLQHKEARLMRASVQVRLSIGVAYERGAHADADTIVALADRAMYESKRDGSGPQLASPQGSAGPHGAQGAVTRASEVHVHSTERTAADR